MLDKMERHNRSKLPIVKNAHVLSVPLQHPSPFRAPAGLLDAILGNIEARALIAILEQG